MKVFHDMTTGLRVTIDDRGNASEIAKYLASPQLWLSSGNITTGPITIVCGDASYPIAPGCIAVMGGNYPGT